MGGMSKYHTQKKVIIKIKVINETGVVLAFECLYREMRRKYKGSLAL